MNIYLLRHAIAVPRGTSGFPNDDRPLTDEGRNKMIKASKTFGKVVKSVDIIFTSPLLRATETAKIAAKALNAEKKITICNMLLPENKSKMVIEYLANYHSMKNIILVGHEPQIGLLTTMLLGSGKEFIEIKKGSLLCIEIESLRPLSKGKLLWHLQPKHLRMMA